MSYNGTTAASSVSNPPIQLVRAMGGSVNGSTVPFGCGLWLYSSTDSSTAVQSATYFTDANVLGMRQGDVVINVWQSSYGSSQVISIGVLTSLTTAGAAGLSTGGAITSTH